MYSVIMIHSYISNLIAVIVWSHVDLPLTSCQVAPSTKDEHQGSLGKEVKEMMGNNVPMSNCLTYGSCWVEVPVHWGLTNTGLRNRRIEARILVWLKRKFTSSFQVMFVRSSLYTSCPNLNKVYSFNVSTIHYSHLELGHGYLQGGFFDWSAQFSVPKRKTLFNQRGSFVHREFHGIEPLIGCP